MKQKNRKKRVFYFCGIASIILSTVFLFACAYEGIENTANSTDISTGILRKVVFSLVSSAENSSIDYEKQYAYIEDIGDGRGYTAGIIGFTSGTGDLLIVIEEYCKLKPQNNILKQYIPALQTVVNTDSHEGLGNAFLSDWETATQDSEMIAAQNSVLDEMYLFPAIAFANEDGLSILGQYIYYDAFVVHGPGNDAESFNGIRMAAKASCKTPSIGGNEKKYLLSFLHARSIVMKKEEAHSDLSRINTQKKFLHDRNYTLALPLTWTMYGDKFTLTQADLTNQP